MGDQTTETRIRQMVTKQVEAAKDNPVRKWALVVLVPLILSGTCWAGTSVIVDIPGVGEMQWKGEEVEP